MGVKKRRAEADASLKIDSMMDMMTIILVFLLKSYATTDVSVAPSDQLKLPVSSAQKPPQLAVSVIVEKGQVLVDGVPVMLLGVEPDEANPGQELVVVPEDELRGQVISKLYDRLLEKAEAAKTLGERSGSAEHSFKGRILMQIDKDTPFSVVRKVMYTSGQAQFGEFKFVVIKSS